MIARRQLVQLRLPIAGYAFDDPFHVLQVFQELVHGRFRGQFPGHRIGMLQRLGSQLPNQIMDIATLAPAVTQMQVLTCARQTSS